MRFKIGSALIGMALAVSMTAVALAQADDDTAGPDDPVPTDTVAAPVANQSAPPMLFLQLVDPTEEDVEVPLGTAQLTVRGVTLPGAVVSVDGDLAVTDDQGGFVDLIPLDEGANEIEVANASIKPEMVLPSLAITRKISPGEPSSNIPTVM